MTESMKTIRIILLVFIMMACTKENDNYRSQGEITGYDVTMCACCGGLIIIIDEVRYLIDSLPDNSEINKVETYPISVKLDWQLIRQGCPNNRISVQRIKKI
jgi:hypothetical protein